MANDESVGLGEQTEFISLEGTDITFGGEHLADDEKEEVLRCVHGDYLFGTWRKSIDEESGEGAYLRDHEIIKVSSLSLQEINTLEWLEKEYGQLPPDGIFIVLAEGYTIGESGLYGHDPGEEEKSRKAIYITIGDDFGERLPEGDKYKNEVFFSCLIHEFAHFLLVDHPSFADRSRRYGLVHKYDDDAEIYKEETYTNALTMRILRKFDKAHPNTIDITKCREFSGVANTLYKGS